MSLHKPGKEHTINFIYCWAALHPDPSHRSDPYSQRLGPGSTEDTSGVRQEHSWAGEGALGMGWAVQALCFSRRPHRARSTHLPGSPRRPRTSPAVGEARASAPPLHLRLENLRPPRHPPPPARPRSQDPAWTGQPRVCSPCLTLTLDSEAG